MLGRSMEKAADPFNNTRRHARGISRLSRALSGLTGAILCLTVVVLCRQIGVSIENPFLFPYNELSENPKEVPRRFAWEDLKPAKHIQYTPCPDEGNLQCARLELPLDWKNASNPKTIALAVIRLPARVPVTDARYGGAIIINPGGPGGSGIDAVMRLGQALLDILDSAEKFFDIVSFDPRGVGFTTPPGHCFNSRIDRYSFFERRQSTGILNSSNVALPEQYYMAEALGRACAPDDVDSILHHMTTPYVASDMLALVEEHGYWREKQAHGMIRAGYDPSKELLQYWGFSYGTLLGGTFASLFPDRVGRMALDGVVDSDDYYATRWLGNLIDTEAVVDAFYSDCAIAGPESCALASAKRSDGPSIRAAVEDLLSDMKTHPIPVTTEHTAQLVTFSDVKASLFTTLYHPAGFQEEASILAALIDHRNGSLLASRLREMDSFSCQHPRAVDDVAQTWETSAHILCSDGESVARHPIESVGLYLEAQLAISPTAGDIWASIAIDCTGMTTRSPWTFDRSESGAHKTANPILFVGNTGDPVTPLANAKKMQKKFGGSHLLVHDGIGHCSIAEFSSCTAKAIQKYFQDGQLPRDGLVCPVDWHPFATKGHDRETVIAGMGREDAKIATAYDKIEKAFRDQSWGLGKARTGRKFK